MDKGKLIGGMVKTVFILCYVAFMIASIRHVAVFFNDFEPNNDNTFGSYALAGAFDVTALVTTIGVMFFRKSMPGWVFCIVWLFIAGIAAYSYVINLEYTSHYQDMTLLLQPTGQTTAVYDAQGTLHYVPVMQVNTTLEWLNPFLASGFTIFSLIYSVIAEFFGAKPITAEELLAKKQYLEETSQIKADIKLLEGEKPDILQGIESGVGRAKKAISALSSKENKHLEIMERALAYLRNAPSLLDVSQEKVAVQSLVTALRISKKDAIACLIPSRSIIAKELANVPNNDDELPEEEEHNQIDNEDLSEEEDETNDEISEEEDTSKDTGQLPTDLELMRVVRQYPMIADWYSRGVRSVSVDTIIKATNMRRTTVEKAIASGILKKTVNENLYRVSSVVNWLKTMPVRRTSTGVKERSTGELEAVTLASQSS